MDSTPTRRVMLGALGAMPVFGALAAPALASATGPTPFALAHARYIATRDALNNSPDDFELTYPAAYRAMEDRHSEALDGVDDATPTDWREFVQKLEAAIGDGVTPGAELCDRLIAEAKRLVVGGLN